MSSAIRSMERSTIHPMSCSGDDRVPPMFVVPVWKPRHPPPGFLFWRAASRRQHAVEPAQGIVVHIAVMTAGQRDVECDDTHGVWAKSYLKPVRRSQAHRCRGRFDSGDSRTAVG